MPRTKRRKRNKAKPAESPEVSARRRRVRYDPTTVVRYARQRVLGMTEDQARDGKCATAIGRLYLRGRISLLEHDAAEHYKKLYDEAMRAIKAPIGLQVTNQAGDGGDIITPAYEEWATAAVARFRVVQVGLEDVGVASTMRWVVALDYDPTDEMLPALKEGLRILTKRFWQT